MTALYLIGSTYSRFHSELGLLRMREIIPACDGCGYPAWNPTDVFQYFWDTGFGAPSRSIQDGHEVFWCDLSMLMVAARVNRMTDLHAFFSVMPAECMASHEASARYDIPGHAYDLPLVWLRPSLGIDVCDKRFPLCSKCGRFANVARQLTRLHCRRDDLPDGGVFQVKQNRGCATFVTEEGRSAILQTGLRGIGFYPAGKVID